MWQKPKSLKFLKQQPVRGWHGAGAGATQGAGSQGAAHCFLWQQADASLESSAPNRPVSAKVSRYRRMELSPTR